MEFQKIRERNSIHNEAFYKKMSERYQKYCVLFLQAPFGMGKSTVVDNTLLYSGVSDSLWVVWEEESFQIESLRLQIKRLRPSVVVVRHFERARESEQLDAFLLLIKEHKSKIKFIILSAATLPLQMLPMTNSGSFIALGTKDLSPNKKEVREFFEAEDLYVSDYDLYSIERDFNNIPICISLLVGRLRESRGGYDNSVKNKCLEDIFNYIDIVFFRAMDITLQNRLLKLAYFDEISMELLETIFDFQKEEQQAFEQQVRRMGSVLEETSQVGVYRFYPMMHAFLQRNVQKYIENSEMDEIYNKAVSFYLERKQYESALKFAGILEQEETITQILNLIITMQVINTNYFFVEEYLSCLPDNLIRQYPRLIVGKAMLEGVLFHPEQAKYWYQVLEKMEREEIDAEKKKEMTTCLRYLHIAIPGMNNHGLLEQLGSLAEGFIKKSDEEFNIIITSNLPSIIHGGKDFCKYAVSFRQVLTRIETFIERIFGKKDSAIVPLASGEILYEQNQLDKAMIDLQRGIQNAEIHKNAPLYFMGNAVLCRLLIVENQQEKIMPIIENIEKMGQEMPYGTLRGNIKAFQIEIALMQGKIEKADLWMREEAPGDGARFNTMLRYQYLVKIKIMILRREYLPAQYHINLLKEYAKSYEMHYLRIQLLILEAIIHYRQNHKDYEQIVCEALEAGKEIAFIRVFADEGAALYPLLQELDKKHLLKHHDYYMQVNKATQIQMNRYPDYLKELKENVDLTQAEQEVLAFLAKGKKNIEIAEALFISENTVKYHLKNIYSKLNVTSRSQAVRRVVEEGILNQIVT